ncbi:hypothetical protein [Facklamia miroungae]|uniref:N-acetyltransferase domain-containing protein n=1 Tax=Facklamia miroungae TaxID=120956 RepID=A0A1G7QV29_9LACT|nr:hypothetical protein [Facklamia miroungae]NKZ29077.1 hypothetical protein [Facklamia miroungae]SDG02372.1 hypothetical protein SAMN05421791_102231 [Facklamia miroungae]
MNEKLKMSFVGAAAKFNYDLNSLEELTNPKRVDQYILSELNELLELNNKSVMQARAEYFKIPGTVPSDYEQKLIRIEDSDQYVLAGIRHFGQNPKKPFIYIWANFKIEENKMESITKNILPYFEIFNPLHISYMCSPKLLSKHENSNNFSVSQKFYIANLKRIHAHTFPNKNKELTLEKIENQDYYSWYEKEYSLFHQMAPEMRDIVPVNNFELMEKCREENLLYYGTVNNEKVGLIAAEKNDIFGIKGIYINEIMIAKDYRGNKYSESLLANFAASLPKSVKVLWSHIDSRNIPSTKSALNLGQKVFSIECFYKL